VLVTSFVRTLPIVLSSLMERMAPEVADRVEFTSVHAFALRLLKSRGIRVSLNASAADRVFDAAWASVGKNEMLGRIDPRKDYWKDEVVSVIKGRGLTRFEQYAALARVGRKRAPTTEGRNAVWQLHSEYDLSLREAGICDFADVILRAEKSLRDEPPEGYSAIVSDEAQDLSCAMVRMLHAIVGDAPDGLNLIGDGQQTIHPGGYTPGEANVSIAGRGVIMTRNYRNTVEIADFASSLVVGDEFMDIEGLPSAADVASGVVRHGSKPRVSRFTSRAGHDRALMQHVRSLLSSGTNGGDIGVLTQTNYAANDVIAALRVEGIPAVDLHDYDGRTTNCVKVGTIKRAKGLEFKQVVVARTPAQLLEAAGAQVESAIAERRELDRRELYVAMTRARDGLWVGGA
jgi:superfamily I DNA/RNA helicase